VTPDSTDAARSAAASGAGPAGGGLRTILLRGNVLWVSVVSLLTDLASEMMNPLLPIFVAGLVPVGAAPVVLGAMEGLAGASASVVKLVSGRLSDRLGKRKALVLRGYGLSALARPTMALAGAGWQVVGLKFVDRVVAPARQRLRGVPRGAGAGGAAGEPAVRGVLGRARGPHRVHDRRRAGGRGRAAARAGARARAAEVLRGMSRGACPERHVPRGMSW